MKVAGAIRSRDEFSDTTFLCHQHVTELEAILVVAPEVQESTGFRRNVRIIKECTVRRRWIIVFCI